MKKIGVVGAGSFGTAVANALSLSATNDVTLFCRQKQIACEINMTKVNSKYFPFVKLNDSLKASSDFSLLRNLDIIFLAVPSWAVEDVVGKNKIFLEEKIIINLSKGFSKKGDLLIHSLSRILPDSEILTMKGPTFAAELIQGMPSGFTVGCSVGVKKTVENIIENTNIFLDFHNHPDSVELISIFKNIYAMIVGIVDARLNSVNTRFLIFTKIFSELRRLLLLYNADISVMHKYCGIGDLGLTSLNDLSRNRTLGLMIGKGFLGKGKVHSALIEGLRTLDIVYRFLIEKKVVMDFPLIASLWKLIRFSSSYSVNSFIQDILGK